MCVCYSWLLFMSLLVYKVAIDSFVPTSFLTLKIRYNNTNTNRYEFMCYQKYNLIIIQCSHQKTEKPSFWTVIQCHLALWIKIRKKIETANWTREAEMPTKCQKSDSIEIRSISIRKIWWNGCSMSRFLLCRENYNQKKFEYSRWMQPSLNRKKL